jgi:hypothetical protein
MAYFNDRDLIDRGNTVGGNCARKLIPLGGAHAWPFASCRRYLPWYYSSLLVRGRQPIMSLPAPVTETTRSGPQRPQRGNANAVRMKLRPVSVTEVK